MLGRGGRRSGATSTDDDKADGYIAGNCYKDERGFTLEERHEWSGLKAVFSIEQAISTPQRVTTETNYYISSANESAENLLRISREHWNVESMHWCLAVVFSEDKSRFYSRMPTLPE